MKEERFIDPKRNSLVTVPDYLKKYFINMKYLYVPNILLLDKIYIFYFTKIKRKISFYFKLLFKSKINFKAPVKKEYLIFDKENSEYLEYVFSKKNYFIIKSRLEHIEEFYFNFEIILFCLKNIFKRSLRLNYLIIITKLVNPKIILTMIDNSTDFFIISNYFRNKEIKFIAIQNANRMVDMPMVYKNRFVHYYYIIGDYEKKILKNKEKTILNLISIGSLKASIAKNLLTKNDVNLRNDYYDLCVICDPYYFTNEKELLKMDRNLIIENIYKVAEYALKYAKKFNKKILFSGKTEVTNPLKNAEELFYKNYMKDKDFQITFKDRKNFGNYANLYESKIIVGYSSTMLREAFEFKKKVLCLDFAKVDNIDFPSNGICLLEDKSYDSFEKRISKILNMNYESYLDEIEDINSIYNSKFDALQFLKNEIKRW